MDYIKNFKSKLVKLILKKNTEPAFDTNINYNHVLSSPETKLDKTILENRKTKISNFDTPILKRNNLFFNNNITINKKKYSNHNYNSCL